MSKFTAVFLVVALTGCSTKSALKLSPPPPVCAEYNTSDVLVSYGPAVAKEQTIRDFSRRVDRYLVTYLKEEGVQSAKGTCTTNVDAILQVRLDAIESVASEKISFFSLTGTIPTVHARAKYAMVFKSPGGNVLVEYEDDRNRESLDELAATVASRLYRSVMRYY